MITSDMPVYDPVNDKTYDFANRIRRGLDIMDLTLSDHFAAVYAMRRNTMLMRYIINADSRSRRLR